jgi:hypothetical protein
MPASIAQDVSCPVSAAAGGTEPRRGRGQRLGSCAPQPQSDSNRSMSGVMKLTDHRLRQVPSVEQAGLSHRSSCPQHVLPGERSVSSLSKKGADKSLSLREPPHCGQAALSVLDLSHTSTCFSQL